MGHDRSPDIDVVKNGAMTTNPAGEVFRDRVRVSVDAGIAQVMLARPDKRNALDGAMFAAIAEAGERLKHEPGVRAVVLSGEGSSFCAGLDFALARLKG